MNECRKCGNCFNRAYFSIFGKEICPNYEQARDINDEIEIANECRKYEYGTPECFTEEYLEYMGLI